MNNYILRCFAWTTVFKATVPGVQVAEVVGDLLQFVGREAVVVVQQMVARWTGRTLWINYEFKTKQEEAESEEPLEKALQKLRWKIWRH